jgi:hypothetical protein
LDLGECFLFISFAYKHHLLGFLTSVLSLCSSLSFLNSCLPCLFWIGVFLHMNVSYSLQWPQVDRAKDIVFRFIIGYSSLRDFGP